MTKMRALCFVSIVLVCLIPVTAAWARRTRAPVVEPAPFRYSPSGGTGTDSEVDS